MTVAPTSALWSCIQSHLSVYLRVCNAATSEILDFKTSLLLHAGTPSEYLGQIRVSRSSDEGQGHRRRRRVCMVCFTLKGKVV